MALQSTLQVLIDIKSKLEGLDLAVAQMRVLKYETEATAKAGAGGFAQLFKIGEALDLTRRLNDVIAEIPGKLLEWTTEGIRFNATMETAKVAIAAALRQFDSANFPTFQAGLAKSGDLIDTLRDKSNQFGLNFEGVLHAYQSTAAAMFSAGVKDLQKQVDLTILLQRALASLPLAENQKQRDIIDILTGQAKRTEAGRALGIDDAALDRAKESGQFVQELSRQLSGFLEAGDASANTFNATLNRLTNNILRLKQVATEDTTSGLKKALDQANEALSSDRAVGSARGTGIFLGQLVDSGRELVSKLVPDIKTTADAIQVLKDASEQKESLGFLPTFVQDQMIGQAQQILLTEQKRLDTFTQQAIAIEQQQGAYRAQLEAAKTLKDTQAATAVGLQVLADKDKLRAQIEAEINRLTAEGGTHNQNSINLLRVLDEELDRAKTNSEGLGRALAVAGGILKSMGNEAENLAQKIGGALSKVNNELALGSALGPAGRVNELQRQQNADLARASQLAGNVVGGKIDLSSINALRDFIKELDKPDTPALVGPKTKADVEELIKLYEQMGQRQLQVKAGVEAENVERKKISDNVGDFNFKLRQAEIDGVKFRGEDITAAQHSLDIDQKRKDLTDSFKTALEEGRITQAQVNALADEQVRNDERNNKLIEDRKNLKTGERDAHRDIVAFEREESSLLQTIRQNQQLIAENPFLSISEKNSETLTLMNSEIEQLNVKVAAGQALLHGGTLDKATYDQVEPKVSALIFKMEELRLKTQTLTFGGGLGANLMAWVSSFGDQATQIGNVIQGTINAGLQGTNQLLLDSVFRTGDWKKALVGVEEQVANVFLTWIEHEALQFVASQIHILLTGQTQTAAHVAALPAATAHAAAENAGTWGTAAIVGAAALVVAIGIMIAAMGGFEGGGFTGGTNPKRIAGWTHEKEFVQPEPSVSYYGLPFHEAIRRRAIPAAQAQALIGNYRYPVTPRLGAFEMGGAVAAISESTDQRAQSGGNARGSQTQVVANHAFFYDRAEALEWLKTRDGENFFVDLVNRTSHRVRS
jgi:hypothetical protein